MNGKKLVNFLILRSAFTQRNFTSLLLVGLFVGIFILSGGKMTMTIPKLSQTESFGAVKLPDEAPGENPAATSVDEAAQQSHSLQVLGVTPSEDRASREEAINTRGKLFDSTVDDDKDNEKLDKNGLLGEDGTNIREERKLRKLEIRPSDSLSAIEERLGVKRR